MLYYLYFALKNLKADNKSVELTKLLEAKKKPETGFDN